MRFERNTAKLSSMVSCFIFYKNKVNEGYGYQLRKGTFKLTRALKGTILLYSSLRNFTPNSSEQ